MFRGFRESFKFTLLEFFQREQSGFRTQIMLLLDFKRSLKSTQNFALHSIWPNSTPIVKTLTTSKENWNHLLSSILEVPSREKQTNNITAGQQYMSSIWSLLTWMAKKRDFSTKCSANRNSNFIANISVKTGLELCCKKEQVWIFYLPHSLLLLSLIFIKILPS